MSALGSLTSISSISNEEALETLLQGSIEDNQGVTVTAGLLKDMMQELTSLRERNNEVSFNSSIDYMNTSYGL